MAESVFGVTSTDSVMSKYVLQLVAFDTDRAFTMGTAVWLGHGLLVTAAHIIDACEQAWALTRDGQRLFGEFNLCAIRVGPQGREARFEVRAVSRSKVTDIAVLHVEGAAEHVPTQFPRMTLIPPQVGERISAFGFAGRAELTGEYIDLDPAPRSAIGTVSAVFHDRRDSVMQPWPCFELDARFDDSMSGGPAFDSGGRLVGLISSTLPPSQEGEPHTSYVTLLWPALGIDVGRFEGGTPKRGPLTLMRVVESFRPLPMGWDRITIEPDGTFRLSIDQGGGPDAIAPD